MELEGPELSSIIQNSLREHLLSYAKENSKAFKPEEEIADKSPPPQFLQSSKLK